MADEYRYAQGEYDGEEGWGEVSGPSLDVPHFDGSHLGDAAELSQADSLDEALLPRPGSGSSGASRSGSESKKRGGSRRRGASQSSARRFHSPEEKLKILQSWMRSKLPGTEFADLVGVTNSTLYQWRKAFEERGPAGLESAARGRKQGSRLPEPVRRAILLMKEMHEAWGVQRIHDVLLRSEGFSASPGAIRKVLVDEGYVLEEVPIPRNPPKVKRFERTAPNQLWQTDLFTFMLRRQNRRVYLVVFLDDFSRFIVVFAVHVTQSGVFVRDALKEGVASYGAPVEVLTDNGTQYHTWQGKSAFRKLCEQLGIRQIVAKPRRPQTLGKVERFWGTLQREFLAIERETREFESVEDLRVRLAHFIDHYNFHRPHQGIGGLVPADRYFGADAEVRAALEARVAGNALELALHGQPRKAMYLAGRVGDASVSLHSEGGRIILTEAGKPREEVDLAAPGRRAPTGTPAQMPAPLAATPEPPEVPGLEQDDEDLPPGSSPLDEALELLANTGIARRPEDEGEPEEAGEDPPPAAGDRQAEDRQAEELQGATEGEEG